MAFAHLKRTLFALAVHQPRLQHVEHVAEWLDEEVDPGAIGAADHFVDLFAFPPAIHITFTDAQHAIREDPRKDLLVAYLDVPGTVAVNSDIGGG